MAENPPPVTPRAAWAQACRRVAWIAGVFCVLLAGLLLYNSSRIYRGVAAPKLRVVEGADLLPLRQALREDPSNQELKERLRQADLEAREGYFRREAVAGRAGWALLGGAAVLLLALHGARRWSRPPLPCPVIPPRKPDAERKATVAARAVAAVALGLAGLAVPIAWSVSSQWQDLAAVEGVAEQPAGGDEVPAADDFPTAEEIAANWPRFRGPDGSGVSALTDLPEDWDGPSGRNILWKTPLELPGKNSAVVWGGRVFTSGATEKKRQVYCHDATNGSLLWQAEVGTPQSARAEPPEILEDTGYAAPTMVTDGRRVFAIFANGDVAGFTVAGKPLWTRSLGTPINMYGHATSLALWRHVVIVVFDQGAADEGLSKIIGMDAHTGKSLWETKREVANSWTSPVVVEVDGKPQVLTSSEPWVVAYHPADGRELWKANLLEGDVAPAPILANGLVYVGCDRSCVAAIRPDGSGDVTESHVAWKQEDAGLPDMCGLLCDGPRLYTLVYGVLYAFDAMDGKVLWEVDTGKKFEASPSFFHGSLHLLTTAGEWITGTADGEGFTETRSLKLGEKVSASPAFMPGRIYLRAEKHLYCIGNGG